MNKINFTNILPVIIMAVTFSSCQAIGSIFKAGVGVGIAIVVVVIIVIIWIISKVGKKS